MVFSQHSSPVHINENKLALPRFAINDEFGGMKRFYSNSKLKSINIIDLKVLKDDSNLEKFEVYLVQTKLKMKLTVILTIMQLKKNNKQKNHQSKNY